MSTGLSPGFISSLVSSSIGYQSAGIGQVVIAPQEKAQFDQVLTNIGLTAENINQFYTDDLAITYEDAKDQKMYFGASLQELAEKREYDGLYNGATGLNLDYAQERTKVLQELISVMELARQSGDARIVYHFLQRTEAASKKAGIDVADSLHWRELEAAARHACKDDAKAMGYITRDKRSCYADMQSFGAETCVFDAALAELKTRYEHIAQIKGGEHSNFEQAKPGFCSKFAAGVNDMGVLKTAGQIGTAWALWSYKGAVGAAIKWGWNALKLPGPLKIIGGVLLAGALIAKVVGDVENGESWTQSVKEYLPDSFGSFAKGVVDLVIPDVPKLWGSSFWFWCDSHDQQDLRKEIKAA